MALSGAYFNATYYITQYKDVANNWSGSPLDHYTNYGAAEGRNPNAWFDAQYYRANAEAAVQSMTALEAFTHYEAFGWAEGRTVSSTYANFNEAQYLADYPDLVTGQITASTALWHYLNYGSTSAENRIAKNDDGSVISGSSNQGTSYALTTSIDTLVGTTGDDTFSGANSTAATQFGTLDSINGGGGTDTLALGLIAAYAGGATIQNIEKIILTQTTAGGFNATGITGLTDFTTNASTVDVAVTNLASATNIAVSNQDTAVTITYADSAVSGSADSVSLSLSNVAQAGGTAIALNNTTATAGAVGIETLNVNLLGAAGLGTNAVTINTNATASLTKMVFTGSGAGIIVTGTNVTTTAKTLDASATTGGLTLIGLGAAAHTITMGSGNDAVFFGGNLTSADTVAGGTGTDMLSSTAANWNTLNTAGATLSNVSGFELLQIVDDAASGVSATVNAALVGATSVRVAAQVQAGGETVTVNNLGDASGNASVRLDGSVTGLTLNIKDATLPATANTVNLDVRGTAQTTTFTMNGVETVNVDASNSVTSHILAMTDGSLKTLTVTNTGAGTFNTGTLGATIETVDLSKVTGGGATTTTLTAGATTGVNFTGSAGVDNLTATNAVDIISLGTGSDVVTGLNGGDRINVGSGTDTITYTAAGETHAGAVTTGTTVLTGVDQITGMGTGDIIATFAAATVTGATTVSNSLITAGTTDAIALVRGNFNTSTDIFTVSATGTDVLYQFDNNGTTALGTIENVVLIGTTNVAATFALNTITLA